MDRILNSWLVIAVTSAVSIISIVSLRRKRQAHRAALAAASSLNFTVQPPAQLNDYVFEVHRPQGRPSIEVVFFHGLQWEESKEVYLTTWLSADGSELWLKWILETVPDARILLISYDAFARRTYEHGLVDMYITAENLVQSLIDDAAQIGRDGCPVVFVGHCLGGLVIKELCTKLQSTINKRLLHNRKELIQNLLFNVKGLFFYACPHQGSSLADKLTQFSKGLLFEDVTTLNKEAQRRNEEFRQLRLQYGWETYGIGEGRETTLEQFRNIRVVAEASARHDVDTFYTITEADHFTVCQPKSIKSSSFSLLSNFIASILKKVLTPFQIPGLRLLRMSCTDLPRNICLDGFIVQDKMTIFIITTSRSKAREMEISTITSNRDVELQGPKQYIPHEVTGLDDQVKTILFRLVEAQHLAILGMGGIGKTTFAKVVYNKISGNFDYTCFLLEVKVFMTSEDPSHLQKEIIRNMLYKGRLVEPNFEWDSLHGKHVLLLLDDVNPRSPLLKMIDSGFSSHSRTIITSREMGFLSPKFLCNFMEQLEIEDSKKLISRYAFEKEYAPDSCKDHVVKVARKCGGLPLALEIVGKHLFGEEDPLLWDEVAERLRRAESIDGNKENRLSSIIMLSYESLGEQEKEMFLDIATCFGDEDLDEVKQAWSLCGWASTASLGLKNLLGKGFITYGKTVEQKPCILMHEVLRDLGRSIACPSSENVARHTRMCCDTSDQLPLIWPSDKERPAVKVLKMKTWYRTVNNVLELQGWEGLRIVWLHGVKLYGPCHLLPPRLACLRIKSCYWTDRLDSRSSNQDESSPSKIIERAHQALGRHSKLLHLEIDECQELEGFLHSVEELDALEYLIIRSQHWEELPEVFGKLRALKHLKIISCRRFQSIPDYLKQLPSLKCLIIQDCENLRCIPDWLGQLEALEDLRILCCWLNASPHSLVELKSLRRFEMTCCRDWNALLDTLKQMQALQTFVMHRCAQHDECLRTIDQLQFLESLSRRGILQSHVGQIDLPAFHEELMKIVDCDLERLPGTIEQLQALRELRIQSCGYLECLPNSIGKLQMLETLIIQNCNNLKSLPHSVGDLQALRHLKMVSCGVLESLPESLGKLQALETLTIRDCKNLKSLPRTVGELQVLQRCRIDSCTYLNSHLYALGEHLSIRNCNDILALPNIFGDFRALRYLKIESCRNLKSLPDVFGNLQALEYLQIRDCNDLETLPGTLGELEGLQDSTKQSYRQLESLPESLGKLQAQGGLLKRNSNDVEALRNIPNTLGDLRALRRLKIQSCKKLRSLPDALGNLQTLQYLEVKDCTNLDALPETLGELRALRVLKIELCKQLKSLPGSLGNLPELRFLKIKDCNDLETLPATLGDLQALVELTLQSCVNLDSLPDSLGKLLALECLIIRDCDNLEALPRSVGGLQALRYCIIDSCKHLTSHPYALGKLVVRGNLLIRNRNDIEALSSTLGDLLGLRHLTIESCVNLKSLPEALGNLQALESLDINACNSLDALPGTLGKLKALQVLKIQSCERLKSLPDALGDLQALTCLTVRDCNDVEALPGTLGQLRVLQELTIESCQRLKSLPDALGNFRALRLLTIVECPIVVLPDSVGELQSLRGLRIASCEHLGCIPATVGNLQALELLALANCNNLVALPDTLGQLRALRHLEIGSCNGLTSLPHTLGELEALRGLLIDSCQQLKSLPDADGRPQSLECLEIRGCNNWEIASDNVWELPASRQFIFWEYERPRPKIPDDEMDRRLHGHIIYFKQYALNNHILRGVQQRSHTKSSH